MKDNANEVNSIFEQPWWLDIVAHDKWHIISLKDKKGKCVCKLPYIDTTKYGLDICGVPVLTQHMGPWFHHSSDKLVSKLSNIKKISENLIVELDKFNNVDLYFHNSYQYVLPFIWAGYKVEPKFSYVLENLSDLDAIFINMDSKIRNLIKAANKKAYVDYNVEADELIALLKSTYEKQGRELPVDEKIIEDIYNTTKEKQAGICIGARDNESKELLAVAHFIYDKNTCYYLLGGKNYKYNTTGVQELVLWEGIKFSATVSKEFDFEGSMIQGIESFFRSFGGRPRVYYRVTKGSFMFNCMEYLKPRIKKFIGYK